MSTTFQSVNRFAVLNNVEPGSSSSKKESRRTLGLATTTTTTTTTNATTSTKKNKTVNEKASGQLNTSNTKNKKSGGSIITGGLPKPIIADSTTTKPHLTPTRPTPTSTLKPRQPTSTRSRNPQENDPVQSISRPAVVDKRRERSKMVGKKTDWEIPRKTLHGSIGFLVLYLHSLHPPTLTPLLKTLLALLLPITLTDLVRTSSPRLNLLYIKAFKRLMRESEEGGWNGVVWYLMGCIWTLGVYPRDVAVVSVLTLSWSDTAASTIGRLLSPHTPPLPPHLPFIPSLRFSPRKSLAGFLAAFLTGTLIGLVFWSDGKHLDGGFGQLWGGNRDLSWWAGERASGWGFLTQNWGRWSSALVLGLTGAVVEALDLGYDDNLTLPILTGAIVWVWLTVVSLLTT